MPISPMETANGTTGSAPGAADKHIGNGNK
jgi:hypothetical protein